MLPHHMPGCASQERQVVWIASRRLCRAEHKVTSARCCPVRCYLALCNERMHKHAGSHAVQIWLCCKHACIPMGMSTHRSMQLRCTPVCLCDAQTLALIDVQALAQQYCIMAGCRLFNKHTSNSQQFPGWLMPYLLYLQEGCATEPVFVQDPLLSESYPMRRLCALVAQGMQVVLGALHVATPADPTLQPLQWTDGDALPSCNCPRG
jgi:hypothetical protein